MINNLIKVLPKTELHLHIEGSLEPELMMELATKNGISLPYETVDEVRQAYQFDNLQSFLDLYYLGAASLVTEDDFYQLMWRYLVRCKEQNIVHCEVMFDPQTHTQRGIEFEVFMEGFVRAIDQAKSEWGQSCYLIMSFLRHLSEQHALETLAAAQPYLSQITAVGLDSSELGNPPEKFARVFAAAKRAGLKTTAHAGEEGPPDYIWQALDILEVDRIDHGVRSIEDSILMQRLAEDKITLTVCPLSNIKLCVFDDMQQHTIMDMLRQGARVMVNSDDPSYFGGYLNENYLQLHETFDLSVDDLSLLVKNSFHGSFLPDSEIQHWLSQVDQVIDNH
ncbi:adenosine deaminase [Aliiglaciecola sp. LCG003]|uniref:adenosine deaminase n=1 Tax=Aliiglaciecola sp. LCG003 TaxID=3053655 RepID=UPI002573EDE4|nr:adenosine deaminase [Aliiglaciecola sp. LCG003]WJG11221.1 adenosine deaminase [Aliiglaciecola sp. LCG003]